MLLFTTHLYKKCEESYLAYQLQLRIHEKEDEGNFLHISFVYYKGITELVSP